MTKDSQRILGINPGTRYLGIAVLYGKELLDWRIKTFPGKWTTEKMAKILKVISDLIKTYQPQYISLKKLHPSRSSKNLKILASKIAALAKRNKVKVVRYSIQEVEKLFLEDKKPNKRNLADRMAIDYPVLVREIKKEKSNRNPYCIRAIEAVALAGTNLISAR